MSQASSPQTTRPPLVSPTNIGSVPSVKQNKECGDAQHNCLDVERPDVCCDNSSYCFINLQNEARCCPIGSNCIADSPCSGKSYYCIITVTKTIRAPNGVGGANKTETATEMGCCSRKCPQPSDFLCPPDLGGKCCPFGSHCQSGGICAQTKMKATSTLSVPLSVAASSAACSSHAKSNGTSCPSETTTSADGDEDEEEDGSDESDALSQVSVGIKAGIGLCASITVLVLLGAAFLYFRGRHRKRKNRRTISSSRAVLTRTALREDSRSDRDRRRRQQQAVVVLSSSEANDNNNNNSSPVEIASVEASSPVSKDRKYMKWASIVPECPGGAFELEGSHTFTTEDDVLPPPPPAPPLTCPPRIGRSSWRNYSPRRRG
ncbi:hypothetical protein E4U32_008245 [Claviceps aff. humidiphila group G2b]|nr:hypothetical protein E4U32_008245 [Claviceps aff. humidiphila group G2b]